MLALQGTIERKDNSISNILRKYIFKKQAKDSQIFFWLYSWKWSLKYGQPKGIRDTDLAVMKMKNSNYDPWMSKKAKNRGWRGGEKEPVVELWIIGNWVKFPYEDERWSIRIQVVKAQETNRIG